MPNSVASASYDPANEQTTFDGTTLTYDQNGNLTNDGTNTYTWDARDRLVGISGGTTASFAYDVFGRRVDKAINGNASIFLYDGPDVVQEIGNSTTDAGYLRSLNIDEPFVRQGSTDEYYHVDGLGSTVALTNTSADLTTNYEYEPFGKTTVTGSSPNAFQFTGREHDGSSLYYYWARYYSPTLQRFISEDPIGFAGGDPNLYAYVFNSPLRYRDPYGLWSVTFDFYAPAGGGITVGQNPGGNWFFTGKVGVGAGGGVSFDPNGSSPGLGGRKPPKGSNFGFGADADLSIGLGPLNLGSLKGEIGGNFPSEGPPTPYSDVNFNPPFTPLSTGKFSLRLGGGVGGQASFY